MATIIDAFVVTLGLDPAGYNKGMGQTREGVKRTKDEALRAGKDIEAGGKQAGQFIGSLKAQVLGLFTVFTAGVGIKDFVRDTLTVNASTGRLARNLGVATEELSTWEGVMRKVGGTNADADQSLQSLVSTLQDIKLNIAPASTPFLQRLGISPSDLENPTKALFKLRDAFEGMDPAQAQRLGAGVGLTPGMVNALLMSRKELEALIEEQIRLGIITKQDAERANQLNHTLSNLADSSATLGRDLLTAAIPALDYLGKMLTRAGKWAQDNSGAVTGAFVAMSAAAVALGVASAAFVAPFIAAAAGIAAVGAAIGFLIRDFQRFQEGGPSAIDWRPFLGGIEAAQQGAKALGDAFGAVMKAGQELLAAVPPGVWDRLGQGFVALGRMLLDGVVSVLNLAVNSLKTMAALIRLITDLLKGDWSAAWKDAGDVAKGTVDMLTQAWEDAKNALTRYWDASQGKGEPLPERPKPRADAPAETYAGGRPKNFDTFQEVQDYFQRQGWTKPQARGIAAGVIAESGGNHRAENPTSGAYGLGQWMRPRAANFERVMGRPLKGSSREDQLKFINWELRHDPHENRVAGKQLAVAQTDRDALDIYVKKFMRPNVQNGEVAGDMSRGQRMLNAPEVVKPKPAPAPAPAAKPAAQGRSAPAAKPAAQGRSAPVAKPPAATTAAIKQTFRIQQAQTTLARKPVTTGAAVAAPVAHRPGPTANDNRTSHETHIGTVAIYTQSKDAPGIARDIGKAIDQRAVATQANSGLS